MRSSNQYLGLGMVVGIAIGAALLLVALLVGMLVPVARPGQWTPTPTVEVVLPTPAGASPPTAIPSNTPVLAVTASPDLAIGLSLSPTPDPISQMITTGGLVFSGPLPTDRQAALYTASLNYVQGSVEDSKRAAKEINGVGYGDPTNICGPLAIAILRDAGVVGEDVVPHDYWLLDPTKVPDQRLLAKAFPAAIFEYSVDKTPLNKIDWKATPLEPGDFLFIWHGSWGNFDHMLVVNRVDQAGRAYAVTNFGTEEGFVIGETMLYDPSDPEAGIFRTWTRQRDQILGSTGFGGFELWRTIRR